MIIDTNRFSDINSFIEHLKENDNIVGIVEYGGRSYKRTRSSYKTIV